VVLLDEIEKAHPDVFNMLLQIMEEGRLTDSFGRHVDFRNTILIMTSNLGSHLMIGGGGLGFNKADSQANAADRQKKMRADVLAEVERQFRPEFLNRVDEQIVFNSLSEDDLKRIIHLQLGDVVQRAKARGLELEVDDKALQFLIAKGFHPDYGARPLRRAIERFVEDPLAEEILRIGEGTKSRMLVTVEGDPKTAEKLAFHPQAGPLEPVAAGAPGESGAKG
jgi:ATP-dependent Clp protease ATP-binding subunit ClpC